MSAKELEDFIKVIETAETIANRPESSIWSYPTDIFSRSRPTDRKYKRYDNIIFFLPNFMENLMSYLGDFSHIIWKNYFLVY